MYRNLRFTTWAEVDAEIKKLEKAKSPASTGKWSINQILEHLDDIISDTVHGKKPQMPWIMKVTLGKMFFKKMMRDGFMKPGNFNPDGAKVRVEKDYRETLEKLKKSILEFKAIVPAEIKENSFMGKITKEQSEKIHIYHIAHHFSFIQYE
jgi:hypothetical protein